MDIISAFLDLFRDYSPERESKKRLAQAKLLLVEAECNREHSISQCEMLKLRIARLEAEQAAAERIDGRPARSSIQAPNPGPARANVGSFAVPDARMRGAQA